MANFSIRTSAQILPLEEIAFTDTTTKSKGIHSTLDKSFSATMEDAYGTTATNIQEFEITFGSDGFTEEKTFKALTGVTANLTFLYAIFKLDTDEEGAYIGIGSSSLTQGYAASFNAGRTGQFMLLQRCSLDPDKVYIGTGGAYLRKKILFVVGHA